MGNTKLEKQVREVNGFTSPSDPWSDKRWSKTKMDSTPAMVVGMVTRSGAGSHECIVNTWDGHEYICNVLVPAVSTSFGYSMTALPVEGQRVLVLVPDLGARAGYILGVIPPNDSVVPNGNPEEHSKRLQPDSLVGLENTMAYKMPMMDKRYASFMNANAQRYVDVLPGEFVLANENDCGLVCSMFSASITSGMAYLKACRLDDTVRIACRTFQLFTSSGSYTIFNDHGYISEKKTVSIYQGERLGVLNLDGKGSFTEYSEDELSGSDYYMRNNFKYPGSSIPRIVTYTGYLGNVFNSFVSIPSSYSDSDGDQFTDYAGVAQFNVDNSGAIRVRSEGGISIERHSGIPVPYEKGNFDSAKDENTKITPFKWSENGCLRPLEIAQAQAYEYKQAYQRFEDSDKYIVDSEVRCHNRIDRNDVWDPDITGSKSKNLSDPEYSERPSEKWKNSGIYMGEDGSIIIRDAWGSEIIMTHGCITMNAANNIHVFPGKTAVIRGGKDVILRARDGVDINSDNGDVRIYARKKLLEKGSYIGIEGGRKVEGSDFDPGIWLWSENWMALTSRDDALVLSQTRCRVSAEGDGGVASCVEVKGESAYILAKSTIELTTEKSLIGMSNNQIYNASHAMSTYVMDSYNVFRNKQQAAIVWSDIKKSIVAKILNSVQDKQSKLQDDMSSHDKLVAFKFRTSEELGTMHGYEIDGPDVFTLYQPFWAFIKDNVGAGESDFWNKEWTVRNNELIGNPWPGTGAVKNGQYAYVYKDNEYDLNFIPKNGCANPYSSTMDDTTPIEYTSIDKFPYNNDTE